MRLQEIMQYLEPRLLIEKTDIPHDNARASCTLQSSVVRSYNEFEDLIIAYVTHHMQETFGSALPPEYCLDKARKFLDNAIGFDNAVYIAMSGSEGGMANVLNQLCEEFKKEAKLAYITYIIDQYIDPLSFDEVVEVMRDLKEKIGHFSLYVVKSFGTVWYEN